MDFEKSINSSEVKKIRMIHVREQKAHDLYAKFGICMTVDKLSQPPRKKSCSKTLVFKRL